MRRSPPPAFLPQATYALHGWLVARWQFLMERWALRPRPSIDAYNDASTPDAVRTLLHRRAGAERTTGRAAASLALAQALARAPGWSPDLLAGALRPWWRRDEARLLWEALAQNPALTSAWVRAAFLPWLDRVHLRDLSPTLLAPFVARGCGATPPTGWDGDPRAWTPLIDAARVMDASAEADALTTAMAQHLVQSPTMTDEALGHLFRAVTESRLATDPPITSKAQEMIVQHAAAGSAVCAAFRACANWSPRRCPWTALRALRPAWLALPAVREALTDLVRTATITQLATPDVRLALASGDPAVVATRWNRALDEDVPQAMAALGALSPEAKALLRVSRHDVIQCLEHLPDTETRLALLTSLDEVSIEEHPTDPPEPAVLTAGSHARPLTLDDRWAAHHPAIRAWLSTQSPEGAAWHAGLTAHLKSVKASRERRNARARHPW